MGVTSLPMVFKDMGVLGPSKVNFDNVRAMRRSQRKLKRNQ